MAKPVYTPSTIPAGTAAWEADYNQSREDLITFLNRQPLALYDHTIGLPSATTFEESIYFDRRTASNPRIMIGNRNPASANDWTMTQQSKLRIINRTTNGAPSTGVLNTNLGAGSALTWQLAPGINSSPGSRYIFINRTVHGIVIDMGASDILRRGTDVTSASGTATTTDLGAALRMVLVYQPTSAATWMVEASIGTWVFA